MPLYEYTCNKCDKQFELLVGVGSGKTVLRCPQCQSKDLRKDFSVFGMRISTEQQTSTTTPSCGSCSASSCSSCLG